MKVVCCSSQDWIAKCRSWKLCLLPILCLVLGLRLNFQGVKQSHEIRNILETPQELQQQFCTLEHFRKYYTEHHSFPGNGKWVTHQNMTDFKPDMCKLHSQPLSPEFIGSCLKKSKLSSILLFGDSNSGRYFRSFMSLFGTVPDNMKVSDQTVCSFVRSEDHQPRYIDKNFYKTGNKIVDDSLQTTNRFCGGCGASEVNCTYSLDKNDNHKLLRMMRIPMTSLIDTSISIVVPVEMRGKEHDFWAPTTQEFLFRYYLQQSYPDVIVFFVPFSHIKDGVNTVERIRGDMEYFHFLAKLHLPKSTRLFYITGPAEHEFAKPASWKGRLFQGMLANEKIDKLNRMMYGVIEKDLLDPGGNMHGFFDLMELGKTRGNWTKGGVHMNYYWYDAIASYLLDIICNSALNDELRFQ